MAFWVIRPHATVFHNDDSIVVIMKTVAWGLITQAAAGQADDMDMLYNLLS